MTAAMSTVTREHLTPWQRYQKDLERPDFHKDPAQEDAVRRLQALYDKLVAAENERSSALARLRRKLRKGREEPIKGLYFWGGVGRGKTYLMDTFYESLPFQRKMRVHFHRFMQRVHNELKALKGEKNPLDLVSRKFADEARVICFDEFFVSDIGDAMILATLMDGLFSRGVTLVCTSNIVPDGLYKDGLQRQRFLPAIELVKRYTDVVNVDGGVDYRLRTLEQAELYHYPLDEQADVSLRKSFESLAVEAAKHSRTLEINGRKIPARAHADDVVWFDFKDVCDGPRSQNDYIEMARQFHAIIISNVPVLGGDKDDQARRFINMIDEFYDRNVKVIISAEAPITELYSGGRLSFEFERTESRLLEMQSREYLEAPHKP
ncbi:cell division protein ZapE [Marinobacter lutaoensis]|jgi:cell division protein ZapE|uniref:Cell division protein ZapE n=1 Tax=Marinobacter lutaoensis TaxID=135739 RepID=A0A1V2DXA1_9GAMM|nr:cell division protein ZapE [Marinobacter lutaoensis]MBI43242.1 cell division protein ZapE [Oceanospirillales bacterium]NVD34977.1 AFG1 family ATPase [Marinobacter lutaoensis]ONF45006.1 cell division protein ZapE [Marinobacter lutaoensis]|tara:strand:- start:4422 stop:5555 length:1134 start_codon:yes stop_codon:yes gene_type:complete